ncbi:hypothetical protein K7W03_08240, partial [Sphingobium sp. PNB]|uniref:hypothetical protein n=1 Tax=Sphingobium sp. PNB TaxID=863934 RepID=UPI001CA443CB
MQSHDAIRQVGFIQQSLSQNRKQIGFFLGAGCPLSIRVNIRVEGETEKSDPLIPDVAGLTSIIDGKLAGKGAKTWDKVVAVVKLDGGNEKNIEHLLRFRGQRLTAGSGVDSRLPFGGGVGRAYW